jgi:hypothetical protein
MSAFDPTRQPLPGILEDQQQKVSTMSAATPQEQILGIVNNHWQSCCVGAAAQLELADLLADGPLHADILGDFFKDVPVQADAYVMRWLLHDWSDEESVAILSNVKKVASPSAHLMLVESVIPETPEFDMGKWMDLNMMVMATGKERTAAEFRDLLDQAGFALEQIVPTPSPLSIVVARPKA